MTVQEQIAAAQEVARVNAQESLRLFASTSSQDAQVIHASSVAFYNEMEDFYHSLTAYEHRSWGKFLEAQITHLISWDTALTMVKLPFHADTPISRLAEHKHTLISRELEKLQHIHEAVKAKQLT